MIKKCPKCTGERPAIEIYCRNIFNGELCNYPLYGVSVVSSDALPPEGLEAPSAPPNDSARQCSQGHTVPAGDLLCPVCSEIVQEPCAQGFGEGPQAPYGRQGEGLEIAPTADGVDAPSAPALEIDGWRAIARLAGFGSSERHLVERVDGGQRGALTLYGRGVELDPDVYAKLRQSRLEQVAEVLAFGHWDGRAYEVVERIDGRSLRDLPLHANDKDALRKLVEAIGRALDGFARIGLRHRDLRPEVIQLRDDAAAGLVVAGFGAARLSEFDLDMVSPGETTRYMAPEAVLGGVAPASDWWSLGIILLEKLTGGACFEGIDERAFLIHTLTRGVPLPEDLDPELALLLRGLLARDRAKRWQWSEVRAWLDGAPVEAPQDARAPAEHTGSAITLGGTELRSPARYALAAAEAAHWDEALDHLARGRLAVWAEEIGLDPKRLAVLRGLLLRELDDDIRLGAALKALNPDLPLVIRGNILTPGWLTQNPEAGYALISGEAPDVLAQLETETWLSQLKRRAETVRKRAAHHEIELNEADLRVYLLSRSPARLRALWEERRKLLPDTDHRGLAAIVDRRQTHDEDLIILLSATVGQFRTVEEIVAEARDLAKTAGVRPFDVDAARATVVERPRREVLRLAAERIADFAHCGIPRVDEWADELRLDRSGPLARALVLLAVPEPRWQKPARRKYLEELITFFEQKIALSIKRGPLARMTIGTSTPRIDAVELDTGRRPAAAMIERILDRSSQASEIDPAVFGEGAMLYERMRVLHQQAAMYKRDTGIDGLYLGFPFLVFQPADATMKTRIAPVLLWPVRIGAQVGGHRFTIAFDTEREEVRLNPALEAFMGHNVAQRWEEARAEGLGRSARLGSILDAFGHLATVRQHELVRLPGDGVAVPPGSGELVCSAVLFHAAFMGQAVLEDLGRLKHVRLDDTALETALRIAGEPHEETTPESPKEIDRYLTVSSDPSQEAAVLSARAGRGLVVEGPPGTGKSQTIVNLVADAVGRKRTLLLVCQKHAALEVVRKRLEAEGLGNRFVMVGDVNRDRLSVVRGIREQVEEILESGLSAGQAAAERAGVAARIEALERDIDAHHCALQAIDPASNRSYRDLIGELVALEDGERSPIDCLALREAVAAFDLPGLAAVEEACAPLGCDWLESGYEGSPLAALDQFAWDTATCAAFARDFEAFRQAEMERARLLDADVPPFKVRALADAALERWIVRVDVAQSEPSFLAWLTLRRLRALLRLRSRLARAGAKLSDASLRDFHRALKSETSLRAALATARASSLAALERLTRWLTPTWLVESRTAISEGRSNAARIEATAQALPKLAAFQRFRARSQGLTLQAWRCLAALREGAGALSGLPPDAVEPEIRRILGREARLAWKARLEAEQPALLLGRAQIEGKVQALAGADAEMRGLNKRALIDAIDTKRLGSRQQWRDISRLQGPQMLSLRQFVERAADIGLFEVRPVWLMNPDVASRLLPLRSGMFDVVVYDEASQMPVECALPTLFRGKAVIVSGDEKQLPPTSFFATRVENDEDDSFDDDELGLEPPEEAEAVWNRREIKDCTDLLALGRSVLPSTMLEVHYRSQFRELIAYSNAAFYSNRLQVPVQHPDGRIVQERPIEVVRVNGVYAAQTNSDEADRVVRILAGYWRKKSNERPSIGVVTFNRKQADLIEARLEARAERNQRFRSVYAQELGRVEDGEDMGFFVKNVENVQGDERDVIVFSTTFGRDRAGGFRRNFGVLGQKGGERRLNVAISRARQKVIVVTSMPVSEVSDMLLSARRPSLPRDFLQGYLHYAEQVSSGNLRAARSALDQAAGHAPRPPRPGAAPSDGFAATVTAYLHELGYEPVPAQDSTAFGLDFAIRHPATGQFGIGIECDAPRHKLLERARAREIWRRSVLARSVPKVHRVSSHGWYYDRETEKRRLAEAVRQALSTTGGMA